jgi:uncharacterized protein
MGRAAKLHLVPGGASTLTRATLAAPPRPVTHVNTQRPLDAEQLDRLERLLEQRALPFQGLGLEGLDGFLSARAVAPVVLDDDWQAQVWGPNPPRWDSPEEAADVAALLAGLEATVQRRVRLGDELPSLLQPLIGLPEDPDADHPDSLDIGREWAEGFFLAVEPVREAWEAWLDAEDWIEEIFVMLEELASGELAVEPGEAPEPLPYRDRLDTIGALPGMLADLHAHRIEHLTPREPVRRAIAPGRNDPCPCGSGRKYKACCGRN